MSFSHSLSSNSQICNSLNLPNNATIPNGGPQIISAEESKTEITKLKTAPEWFAEHFELRTAVPPHSDTSHSAEAQLYLRVQRKYLLALFEKQLKLQASSLWFQLSDHSQEECYLRAYQEALIMLANHCNNKKIPFALSCERSDVVKLISENIIAEEQKNAASNTLTDISHYATAILEMNKLNVVCLGEEHGINIVKHLKAAADISSFPLAMLQLSYLYRNGVDPNQDRASQARETERYMLGAANQNISSAQNDVATFYLREIFGRHLTCDERVEKAICWFKKAEAAGDASATKNLADLDAMVDLANLRVKR